MDERRVAAAGDIALLISRGELPAAARALRSELLGRPDRPDMMNLLARLLETALRTARSPFAPDPPPADIGEDLYLRGFAALGDGQLDAADGAFRAGFAVGPADYACRIALAVIVILATQADGIRLALAEAGAVDVHRIDGLLRIEPVDRPIRGRDSSPTIARSFSCRRPNSRRSFAHSMRSVLKRLLTTGVQRPNDGPAHAPIPVSASQSH